MNGVDKIKVILVKSLIGRLEKHKACAYGLGLKKVNSCVKVENTPSNRGMIDKISYLLKVEI